MRRAPSDPAGGLLGPDDPPACETFNASGRAPVLFLCDHASNRVPAALGGLGLSPAQLDLHIGWDIGAAELTRRLAARFDAPAVLAGYSRLVIDCNRQLRDSQSIIEVSDGVRVPGNAGLSPADADARIAACFRPYHDAVAAVIARTEARGAIPALLLMHSFTPRLDGEERPWHVGVLWADDGRIAVPLMERLRRRGDLRVGDNEPYTGYSPHGYSFPVHVDQPGRAGAQIEVRQDLIGDEAGLARWTEILADALAGVLEDESLYRLRS